MDGHAMNPLMAPDIIGSYMQGAQARQALKSNEQAIKANEMKFADAQAQQAKQQQYNQLMQSGLPPEQMSQQAMKMGNVDLATQLMEYTSKQSKEQQDRIMTGAQNVYAFTTGAKDANDPLFMQGIEKAIQSGMIDQSGAKIAAQLGPQGLEKFVMGAKGMDGSKAFQPVVVSDASGNTQLVMPTYQGGQVGSQQVPIPQGYKAAVETPQQKREREAQSKIAAAGGVEKVTGNVKNWQKIADEGLAIADNYAPITRAKDLLSTIETSGFDAFQLKAKQYFGIEGADEGELSNLLGKSMVAQLRSTFGPQFTEKDREEFAKIEASFSKSPAANYRQLENALKLVERKARRGADAARRSGDDFTAKEIEDALNFRLSDEANRLKSLLDKY